MAKIIPNSILFMYGNKNKYANKAPMGSDNADIKV